MLLYPANIALAIAILALSIVSYGESHNTSHCERSCKGSTLQVPYPFGFSTGCPIQLNCFDGAIRIGEFQVQSITDTGLLLALPAKCNRSIESIRTLFGPNYAPSRSNSLLLQRCGNLTVPCDIAPSLLDRSASCDTGRDKVSCLSTGDNTVTDVLSYEALILTNCSFLFSSFVVDSSSWNDSRVSLDLGRMKLEWWVEGDYGCDRNANNTIVKHGNGKIRHRCVCREGFSGDGFRAGKGCQKVPSASDCNASKYMAGHCGGTTRVGVLVGGIVAGASLMSTVALICYCVRRRSTSRNQTSAKRLLCEAAGNSSVPFYPYREIERATNCFSDKQRLGTGAYGTVYAGKLQNDEWVAIKRFRYKDMDSFDQVMNEIKLLSSVSHPNLVRLLGCCVEEGEPILVYEFMPNGTLSQHLQRERGKGLPWTIRLTIAAETAKAIAYLHSAVNPPIYHRDIKSSNILLDYNYRSKVADFGLSRLGMTESSHISTAPQGTPGYLDPQYHQYFHLSDKSDVYSFGVVLVEIITAMKVVDFSRPHSEVNLAALAIDRIGRGCVDEIIDPYLEPHRDAWTLSSVHNVAELAFRCLAFHRDMRPTMMEVAEELEQIRLSSWVPNMYMASPMASSCSSSDDESEKSCMTVKKKGVGSRELVVPQRIDCLTSLHEAKDSSPVSVQDPWASEQSSPSTNSLLGNVIQ